MLCKRVYYGVYEIFGVASFKIDYELILSQISY